jgi:hypothetical protein
MRTVYRFGRHLGLAALLLAGSALAAMAQTPAAAPAAPKIDSGDTAWMLTSVALVLMMTIPGLALFYGGLHHRQPLCRRDEPVPAVGDGDRLGQ